MTDKNNHLSENSPLINSVNSEEIQIPIYPIDSPGYFQEKLSNDLDDTQKKTSFLRKMGNIIIINVQDMPKNFIWSYVDQKKLRVVAPEGSSPNDVMVYFFTATGPVLLTVSTPITLGIQLYKFYKLPKEDKTFNNATNYFMLTPFYCALVGSSMDAGTTYLSSIFKANKLLGNKDELNAIVGAGLGSVSVGLAIECLPEAFKLIVKSISNGKYFSDHKLENTFLWNCARSAIENFAGAAAFWTMFGLDDSTILSILENHFLTQWGISPKWAYTLAHITKSCIVAGMTYSSTIGSKVVLETVETVATKCLKSETKQRQDEETTLVSNEKIEKQSSQSLLSWCCLYKKKSKHDSFLMGADQKHSINAADSKVKNTDSDTGLTCSIL